MGFFRSNYISGHNCNSNNFFFETYKRINKSIVGFCTKKLWLKILLKKNSLNWRCYFFTRFSYLGI